MTKGRRLLTGQEATKAPWTILLSALRERQAAFGEVISQCAQTCPVIGARITYLPLASGST